MLARAPGKIVISGAYAVLEGAPGIVAAVDRYVVADASRPADFVTPEVAAALAEGEAAPWFDARALRDGDRKLGIGSSAAIVVASLGALAIAKGRSLDNRATVDIIFGRALAAHRAAQGGGSGIDVVASTYGGAQIVRRKPDLEVRAAALPKDAHFVVFSSGTAASTSDFVSKVRQHGGHSPKEHAALIGALGTAAERAEEAFGSGSVADLIEALQAQLTGLDALGRAAGVDIVTADVSALGAAAAREGGVALPSGAGGGDIALFVGTRAPSPTLLGVAKDAGLLPLDVGLAAPGLHAR